jgi:hypothetical protein
MAMTRLAQVLRSLVSGAASAASNGTGLRY